MHSMTPSRFKGMKSARKAIPQRLDDCISTEENVRYNVREAMSTIARCEAGDKSRPETRHDIARTAFTSLGVDDDNKQDYAARLEELQ
jgi:hypothetical protein